MFAYRIGRRRRNDLGLVTSEKTLVCLTRNDYEPDICFWGKAKSLQFKPDVTAPGEDVLSAAPGGSYVENSGTSMASPHVAGAAALLRQRHPSWTPAQVKSALVLTGAPVRASGEVSPLREGGGRIDLPKADQPLLFARPTSVAFGLLRPRATQTRTITLTDAGGGAGNWAVRTAAGVSAPSQVTVPGTLTLRAAVAATARERDVTGFVVLSRGGELSSLAEGLRADVRGECGRDPKCAGSGGQGGLQQDCLHEHGGLHRGAESGGWADQSVG